jgi:hypothetical protein
MSLLASFTHCTAASGGRKAASLQTMDGTLRVHLAAVTNMDGTLRVHLAAVANMDGAPQIRFAEIQKVVNSCQARTVFSFARECRLQTTE